VAVRTDQGLVDAATKLSVDALFPIYSVTKTLTAICAFRLAEEGTLSIDAAVRTYVPDVDLPDSITLAHLLNHTSGLADYGDLSNYHEDVRDHPATPWTRAEFLAAVLPRGVLFEPGRGWSYSNIGYMLVIDAIERATRQTFADAIDRFVREPLALSNTRAVTRVEDLEDCAAGFGSEVNRDRKIVDVRGLYHPGWCAPRLVVSTGRELTAIFAALVNGRLLSPSSRHRMLSTVPLPEPEGTIPTIHAGAGIFTDTTSPFGQNWHHAGGGPGYEISVTTYVDVANGPVTVAVLVNTSANPGDAAKREAEAMRQICA
jgi:D-alanyl-D-alanine carboxypeptidase